MALPSRYRLKRRQDFNQLYRRGQRFSAHYFVIRVLRTSGPPAKGDSSRVEKPSSGTGPPELKSCQIEKDPVKVDLDHLGPAQDGGSDSLVNSNKIGVAVSLKVSKRAVVRNRIRRQVQAAMLQLMPQMMGGWMILVTARSPAAECDYWQFLRELEELLTRAKVIYGHSGRGIF